MPNITRTKKRFWVRAENDDAASVNIYTLATSASDGSITLNKENNATLTGNIYYYSDTKTSGAWHYENGVATLWA